MATYYLDYVNGNDANSGADWANAWKTIGTGAGASDIAPGDVIRIAKSPDPVSVGDGIWTSNTSIPATKSIASSTNATPIVVTITSHGYSNGDVVQITGHTTNTNANGNWKIANVTANTFELVSSVGNGVGGATGTARNINFKSVTLATAQNKLIDRCEATWTAQNSSTVTVSTTTREGSGSASIQKTTPATSTLYAYKALSGATDYSSYQSITFWIQPSVAITAGQWTITLCSDTAGATPVDTFAIPAITSAGRWVPFTIARNGGGNLGASIQSIALNTGATTPATITILLDNIWAATTSGLSLQSLISKNSSAQGGSEPWIPIQSINSDGTVICLDNGTAVAATNGVGYYGTSSTATTYIRETIKTSMAATNVTTVESINDSGTSGNLITFKGGYNTSSSAQDGETLFDGLNGFGNALVSSSKNFWAIEHVGFVRYNIGLSFTSGTDCVIDIPFGCGCTNQIFSGLGNANYNNTVSVNWANNNAGQGVSLAGMIGCTFPVIRCNSNLGANLNISSSTIGCVFTSIPSLSGGLTSGMVIQNGVDNIFNITEIKYNSTYAQGQIAAINCGGENNYISVGTIIGGTGGTFAITSNSGGQNTIANVTSSGYSTSFISTLQSTSVKMFLRNVTSSGESTFVTYNSADYEAWVYSYKHGGVAGDNRIYMVNGNDAGAVVSQTTTRHTASDIAWQMRPLIGRPSYKPIRLKIAEVPCAASALVTVKAWVKLDHATNIAAKLFVRGGQISGVSNNVETAKTADTNWEELTVTFTPSEAGVIEVEVLSWYVAGNSSCYVDDITVTQA